MCLFVRLSFFSSVVIPLIIPRSYTEFLFAMAEGVVGMVGGDNNLESLSKAPSVVPVKHSGWHGGGAGGGGGGHKHHKKAHGVQTPESPLSVAATTSNVDITSTTSSPSMVTPFPSVANQFRSALGVTKMPSLAAHKLPIIRHGRRQVTNPHLLTNMIEEIH